MSNTPPNGIDLAQVAPGKAAMYSPNLWRHLVANHVAGMFATAFRDRGDGTLWLGYMHQGDFVGCKLMHVLCEGKHARTGCFVGLAARLEPVANFWAGYQRLGRCFIDPAHLALGCRSRGCFSLAAARRAASTSLNEGNCK